MTRLFRLPLSTPSPSPANGEGLRNDLSNPALATWSVNLFWISDQVVASTPSAGLATNKHTVVDQRGDISERGVL